MPGRPHPTERPDGPDRTAPHPSAAAPAPASLRSNPAEPAQRPVPQSGERSQEPASGPLVMFAYSFLAGADLQGGLGQVPELACAAGTDILGMCDTAARAWANVEESDGEHMSPLAVKTRRAMVATMKTVMMARSSGARRWCEIATVELAAAEAFLRIFPATQFICLQDEPPPCTDELSHRDTRVRRTPKA